MNIRTIRRIGTGLCIAAGFSLFFSGCKQTSVNTICLADPAHEKDYSREQAADGTVTISVPEYRGKVTDAGYDEILFDYFTIPADKNVSVTARITVHSFAPDTEPTGQEAFGIMIRDTIRPDRNSLFTSDMASVGGFYGRFNVFGRYGTNTENPEDLRNFFRFISAANPLSNLFGNSSLYRISSDDPKTFILTLTKDNTGILASMTDEDGNDVLSDMYNRNQDGGETGRRVYSEDGQYRVYLPTDSFTRGEADCYYAGIFATRNTSISYHPKDVKISVYDQDKDPPAVLPETDYYSVFYTPHVPAQNQRELGDADQVIHVSTEGSVEGSGDRDHPVDIYTATENVRPGQTILVHSGHYKLTESLYAVNSGTEEQPIIVSCEDTAVFDFLGKNSTMDITGDYWQIDNLQITRGMGLMIEGNHNTVTRCMAYENMETGFWISADDIETPSAYWPHDNVISDCIAYGNRDFCENNADGFACKCRSGEGNIFRRCTAFLNTDDGFDLYAKYIPNGAVLVEDCTAFANGYRLAEDELIRTAGDGNGFKLGGSRKYVQHRIYRCTAFGNPTAGFTPNSNPWLYLEDCRGYNNEYNLVEHFGGAENPEKTLINCDFTDLDDFDLLSEIRSYLP
ncbi:MAG: right-handed parallel beta-helix repeat-containing protein [Solobacterium sp.]|nr:right-handed parallel beta-helix repeat-containing protein [Solobacterium sp.]